MARVACKSLGLTGGERGSADHLSRNGEYPDDNANWPVLSGIDCDGDVDSLEECLENASNSCAGDDYLLMCDG